MTKYNWGTLYFVPQAWDGDEDTLHEATIESHPRRTSAFEKAQALWRIAGQDDKAARIGRVIDRACSRKRAYVLLQDDLLELAAALEGLESTLTTHVMDAHRRISPEQVADYRAKYPALDLAVFAGHVPTDGIARELDDVLAVERLIHDAHCRGLDVAFNFDR